MASELEVDKRGDTLAAQRVDDHQGDGKRQTLNSSAQREKPAWSRTTKSGNILRPDPYGDCQEDRQ